MTFPNPCLPRDEVLDPNPDLHFNADRHTLWFIIAISERPKHPSIYRCIFRRTITPFDVSLQFQMDQNTLRFIVAISDGPKHPSIYCCSFRRTKTPFDLLLQFQRTKKTPWFIVAISDGPKHPSIYCCSFNGRKHPWIYRCNFRRTKTPFDLSLQFQVSDGPRHPLIYRCSFRRTNTLFDLSLQFQTDQDTLWFIVGISDGEREPSAWRERAHRLSGTSASACTGRGWTSRPGGGKSRERGRSRRIRLSSPKSTIIPRVRRAYH